MKISASVERRIDAPASLVYRYIADFREHHPRFLPPQFGRLEIETGGVGAGTVHRFTLTMAGRTTGYRERVNVRPRHLSKDVGPRRESRRSSAWPEAPAPGSGP